MRRSTAPAPKGTHRGTPSAAAAVTALVVGLTAVSPGRTHDSTVAAVRSSPGAVALAGAEEVPVTVSVPSGWETQAVFVLESSADPAFGLAFFDVADIYADGCRWEPVQPPVGPTVDDLVAAYSSCRASETP